MRASSTVERKDVPTGRRDGEHDRFARALIERAEVVEQLPALIASP
jgi:hypothetical protein